MKQRLQHLLGFLIFFAGSHSFWVYVSGGLQESHRVEQLSFGPPDALNEILRQHQEEQESIPRRLIFTYEWDLLAKREPIKLYENVQRTIHGYQSLWEDEGGVEVVMLDDVACLEHVQIAAPFLVPYFNSTKTGAYRSDICRVCYLWRFGGYYFDVDMELVQPYTADPGKAFVTVVDLDNRNFFQSFLASTPRHPVLFQSFLQIKAFFESTTRFPPYILMGPYSLKQGYEALGGKHNDLLHDTSTFLAEKDNNKLHPPFQMEQRKPRGIGCCCDVVVISTATGVVYFWSRIVGAGRSCLIRPDS